MVKVHSIRSLYGGIIVVLQPSVLPVEPFYFVFTLTQIEVSVLYAGVAQMGSHAKGVAWQMDAHVGLFHAEVVDQYPPLVRAFRGVHLSRIAKQNIQVCTLKLSGIHTQLLAFQVDAVTLYRELPDGSLHLSVRDKLHGVQLNPAELEFIHFHLTVKQRLQLHVDHHLADVGHGVFLERIGTSRTCTGLDHAHALNTNIQRKFKIHMLHADFHARLFRRNSRHPLYSPVLNGGQVKQHGQQSKQQYGNQNGYSQPLQSAHHALVIIAI